MTHAELNELRKADDPRPFFEALMSMPEADRNAYLSSEKPKPHTAREAAAICRRAVARDLDVPEYSVRIVGPDDEDDTCFVFRAYRLDRHGRPSGDVRAVRVGKYARAENGITS